MFEGENTIKFSKDAAKLMLSRNLSDMFGVPIEVSNVDMGYAGLEVTFSEETGGKALKQDIASADDEGAETLNTIQTETGESNETQKPQNP